MLLLQSDFLSIVYSCWKKNKTGEKYGKNRTTTTPATTENSTINLENFLGRIAFISQQHGPLHGPIEYLCLITVISRQTLFAYFQMILSKNTKRT